VALRAKRASTPRARSNVDAVLLNLHSDDFILKALQNGFALLYRQSHIRRRDLARALNHRNLVLNGFTSNHLSY